MSTGSRWLQPNLAPLFLLLPGFLLRLAPATSNFLNPDEAQHYLLSQQPSLRLTYQASLTITHPPLLIVLLHFWSLLGKSELMLRMPSVLAGTAFCWMMFLWLQRIAGRGAALAGLALLVFSPPLIQLSSEVRQYALLLFFLAACLCCFDYSIEKSSAATMALAGVALDLAILTHYSSFIFAFVFGIYSLLRLRSVKPAKGAARAWVLGQLSAVLLTLFLLTGHVAHMNSIGVPDQLANTYHSAAIFHPGADRLLPFLLRASSRVAGYLVGNKLIGVVEFLAFAAALVLLFRGKVATPGLRPTPRQIGLLLLLPFVVNCGAALVGRYPFGGTRHNILLAPFFMSGVAIAVSLWKARYRWLKPAALAASLAVCNLLPSPVGPYIRPENQNKRLMTEATAFLRESLPPASVIVTDAQGGFLLSYYLCHGPVVQLSSPSQPFLEARCGKDEVVTPDPELFIFQSDTLLPAMQGMERAFRIDSGPPVWLVRAGWLVNQQPELEAQLREIGCNTPADFGRNISVCQVQLNGDRRAPTRPTQPRRAAQRQSKKRASIKARL